MEEVDATNRIETYDSIAKNYFDQDRRLHNLKQTNLQIIPEKIKKSICSLPNNNAAMTYFRKQSAAMTLTFEKFIQERRMSESSTLSTLQQCSQFISYLQMSLKNKDMKTPDLLFHVVLHHSLLFHQYLQFLRDNGLKCSTILIRINSLIHLIQWLRLIQTNHFTELSHVLDRLSIDRSRFNSIASIEQKNKTIDRLIAKRQWVAGGLPSLQEMMVDLWPKFDALVSLSNYQQLTCQQYSWAMGFTFATLWIYGVNARAQCIETMRMKDFKEMEQNGFHLSTNFKTSSTYNYQIVSPTDVLKTFVKHFRSQVIPEHIDSDEATLFPTFKKTPLTKGEVSRKIKEIFKTYGYDLNVTKLRDMLSCHIEELRINGKVSDTGELVSFNSFSLILLLFLNLRI